MQPLVTVIVPIYKVEKYLDKCVESIVNQTYENLEIILVDDGSPDNCPAMCDDWAERDSRIKVVHKQNGGLSSARNAGMKIMNGDYVCFVDSDDYISLHLIEITVENILNSSSDICVYNFVFLDSDGVEKDIGRDKTGVFVGNDILKEYLSFTSFGASACNKLYRTSILKENNLLFDEEIRWGEDHRFNYFVFKCATRVISIEEALYYYLGEREGSITNGVTIGSINRWKLTRFILLNEKETENSSMILDVYVRELLCCCRELLTSNDKALIDKCYAEICNEIKIWSKEFLIQNNSKINSFSVRLICLNRNAFKLFYTTYAKLFK